jgi:Flp pilus assembly protein TadD
VSLAEAVEQARQAVAVNGNDPAAHEVFGRVLAEQGQIDEARRHLERTLQLDPTYAPALAALRSLPIKRSPAFPV